MIVASGFVEVDGLKNVEIIVEELRSRGMEVNDVEKVKVEFLIERDTVGDVKNELDSLKSIQAVKNVHLAYYSLEGTDEGNTFTDNGTGKP